MAKGNEDYKRCPAIVYTDMSGVTACVTKLDGCPKTESTGGPIHYLTDGEHRMTYSVVIGKERMGMTPPY